MSRIFFANLRNVFRPDSGLGEALACEEMRQLSGSRSTDRHKDYSVAIVEWLRSEQPTLVKSIVRSIKSGRCRVILTPT